jgi:hypothetical protein
LVPANAHDLRGARSTTHCRFRGDQELTLVSSSTFFRA